MTLTPQARVVFRRPYLGAEIAPECPAEGCEGGFAYDRETDTAVECPTCGAARAAARDIRMARLPASTIGALAGPKMPVPKLSVVEGREWRRALAHLQSAAKGARQLMDGQPSDAPIVAAVRGAAGTGKTWMLAHTVVGAIVNGVPSLHLSVSDPFASLASLGEGTISTGIKRAERVPLLALDGVGGHRNDKASAALRDLIARRADSWMVTLIATGATRFDLGRELGESVADLLSSSAVDLVHGSLRGIPGGGS